MLAALHHQDCWHLRPCVATRVAWLGLMLAQDPVGNSTDGVPLLRLGQMTRSGLRGMEGVTASDPGDCFLDSPAAAVRSCSQPSLQMGLRTNTVTHIGRSATTARAWMLSLWTRASRSPVDGLGLGFKVLWPTNKEGVGMRAGHRGLSHPHRPAWRVLTANTPAGLSPP